MPYQVRDRLFFGDITAAAVVLKDGSPETTHALSLLSSASISCFSDRRSDISIPTEEIKKVFAGADGSLMNSLPPGKLLYSLECAGPELKLVRMAVPLRDTEDEDLLDHLDVCSDFIDPARKEGSVLVHCYAGVSRSAAVIIAYLMRTEQKSMEGLDDYFLLFLLSSRCRLFLVVDALATIILTLVYKGHSYKQGEKIDSSIFGTDPGLPPELNSSEEVKKNQHNTAYRCKKCQRVLALQENVVSHVPGEGETCFEWQKQKSSNQYNRSQEQECSSLFVEPLKWMTSELLVLQLKKVLWKENSRASIVMHALGTSTGQAFNAAVAAGLLLPFRFIRAKLI